MKRTTHYGETKAQKRADWMARFSDAVVTLDRRHAGRIDWDTAAHLYNIGADPANAATQYTTNRPNGPE